MPPSKNNRDRGRTNPSIVQYWRELLGPEETDRLINEAHKEMEKKYSHTHCMERVPGGIFGTHSCGNKIPVGDTLCSECKARLEAQKKAPPNDPGSATDSQK